MKNCNKCKTDKNLIDFHNSTSAKDGKYSICKKCKDKANMAYQQTKKFKAYKKKLNQKYAKNNKHRLAANYKTSYAISKGIIIRKSCEVCGTEKTHAHHDNYNYPLDVRWLCVSCHKHWHRHNKPVDVKTSIFNIFNKLI